MVAYKLIVKQPVHRAAFMGCVQVALLLPILFGSGCSRPRDETEPTSEARHAGESVARVDVSPAEEGTDPATITSDVTPHALHVHEGDEIQAALDRAAEENVKLVLVHAGVYRPSEPRQALIWLNRRHDGIHLKAVGEVVLTAANPKVAQPQDKSFPAVVNHVVYCGDGLGAETILEGFKITGANNFTTTEGPVIEPTTDPLLKRTAYFYYDGGGVKVFGRSYPTLVDLEICDNYSSPCGAGISIEHRGFCEQQVTIRDCIFRNNRVPLTGAALDLLGDDKGSAARVDNCLFVNNASNCSMDNRSLKLGSWMPKLGHGAITVFTRSKLAMTNCTITGNRNGIDDTSPNSSYQRCIFWKNDQAGGWVQGERYETAITHAQIVRDCVIGGRCERSDLSEHNVVSGSDNPQFDNQFRPANEVYEGKGYRPRRGESFLP